MALTVCVATTGTGFALVWHIWWLVILCFTGLLLTMIARAFATNTEQIIPAAEVARQHRRWLDAIAQNTGITRDAECTSANRGLAAPDEVIR